MCLGAIHWNVLQPWGGKCEGDLQCFYPLTFIAAFFFFVLSHSAFEHCFTVFLISSRTLWREWPLARCSHYLNLNYSLYSCLLKRERKKRYLDLFLTLIEEMPWSVFLFDLRCRSFLFIFLSLAANVNSKGKCVVCLDVIPDRDFSCISLTAHWVIHFADWGMWLTKAVQPKDAR